MIAQSKSSSSSIAPSPNFSIKLNLLGEPPAKLEELFDVPRTLPLCIDSQDRCCSRSSKHKPGSVFRDELDSVINLHGNDGRATKLCRRIILQKFHESTPFLQREMDVITVIKMRAEGLYQLGD